MTYIQTTMVMGRCETCGEEKEIVEIRETAPSDRVVKAICVGCLRKES